MTMMKVLPKIQVLNLATTPAPRRSSVILMAISLLLVGIIFSNSAQAIPAFARKHEAQCTVCHSAWPSLNKVGRTYKENGYRFPEDKTSSFMNWDKTLPVTAVLKARPYEDTDLGDRKLRVLHEMEVMVAGVMGDGFSGFFEIEAEDDAGDGFAVELPVAAIGWHLSKSANVQFSWGPLSWSDPYDVYSNARKMTRNRASLINERFDGADNKGRLRSSRQNFMLYGRPVDMVYYSVGISGVSDDPLAEEENIISGRLAVDVMPDVMVGALLMNGTCAANTNSFVSNCTVARDFSRSGVDVQADLGDLRIMGAYLQAKGDNATASLEEENNSIYAEARYILRQDGEPVWMPLIRLDSYERSDGNDDYDEVTLHLSRYFAPNVRGFIEYINKSAPVSADDDYTFTVQLDLAF